MQRAQVVLFAAVAVCVAASDVFYSELSGRGDALKRRDEAIAGAMDDKALFVEGRIASNGKPTVMIDDGEQNASTKSLNCN